MAPPQVKACLFDMDGLLINTEDMYTEVTNEVLAEHGKGPLPWEVKIHLQGRPGPEAAKRFLEWSQLPYTPDELFAKTSKLQESKWPNTKFMPGALELLEYLKQNDVPIALATSSHTLNYERKTAHLGNGFALFGDHIVTGDDKRIPPGKGKPEPHIWWVALESINKERATKGLEPIEPSECLVFEDGIPGVIAGKAAGCQVVWVPHPQALEVISTERKEEVLGDNTIYSSLEELDKKKFGL